MSQRHSGPLVIASGGGKGGVGRTVVAANLAVALARLGARVVAVDADLGSANLHTLFGVHRPGLTLHALFDGRVDSLEEAVVATNVQRVFLVPGTDAVPGAANLVHARKLKLLRHIHRLDTDVVVLDCGAGINFNVLDFFNTADIRLLVATPQLVSLQNCYGFLKAALYRGLRQAASNNNQTQVIEACTSSQETERIGEAIARVKPQDLAFGARLEHFTSTFDAALIGNQIDDRKEINMIHAIRRMMQDFLSVEVPVRAGILRSRVVHESVTRHRPFLCDHMAEPAGRVLMSIAEQALEANVIYMRRRVAGAHVEMSTPPSEPEAAQEALLPGPLAQYLREHERFEIAWPVEVEHGAATFHAVAMDISLGGVRLKCTEPAAPGELIRICFVDKPRRPVLTGEVVHLRGELAGVRFADSERALAQGLIALARSGVDSDVA